MKKKTFRDKVWDKTGLSFWCDWLQLNPRHFNWLCINFVHLYLEYDKIGNEVVFEVGLMGFNLQWQHSMDKWLETEENKELEKRLKSVMKEIKAKPKKGEKK